MKGSERWHEWHEEMIRREGQDTMVDIQRRWCGACIWWRDHSVHLVDLSNGIRHLYTCMQCTRQTYDDLLEGWYERGTRT